LLLKAPAPATQRVLITRVEKQPETMRDLTEQVEARRKQPAAATGVTGTLQIGLDSFVAQLPRGGKPDATAAFPASACFIATDFAQGGAIDRRELFAQDRVRKGIADCLSALDAVGAQSVVLPLMGAASSGTQADDARFEGQRTLLECRLINATAGRRARHPRFRDPPAQRARGGRGAVGSGTLPDVQSGGREPLGENRSDRVPLVRRTDQTGAPQGAGR
jgi:hypothetical protein